MQAREHAEAYSLLFLDDRPLRDVGDGTGFTIPSQLTELTEIGTDTTTIMFFHPEDGTLLYEVRDATYAKKDGFHFLGTRSVTRSGRTSLAVTIPALVLEVLGLEHGDRRALYWAVEPETLVCQPPAESPYNGHPLG